MSPGPSSRANAPKLAGEAALEPKALRRATELPVPQAAVGCAVSPAGRNPSGHALRIRYPKPCTESHHPPNRSFQRASQAGGPGASGSGLRATPKPKLASVWSGQVQLADPNPIVQDWKQPVRAPSEENQRPRAISKPELASVWSGLDKSSLQTQIQLFKIGSIQLRHHLKKRKASSHPQTQTGIRLVWPGPPCRPKSNCSRLEASS